MTRLEIAYPLPDPPTAPRIEEVVRRRIGGRYSRHEVDAAIVELYQSGLVEDVRFASVPESGGVILKVAVVPRAPIWGKRQ